MHASYDVFTYTDGIGCKCEKKVSINRFLKSAKKVKKGEGRIR